MRVRKAFDDQVRFLKRNADVVSPSDLPAILARGTGRYVLLTFDDGYFDNYSTAFPVLKAHNVPATFFVTTGFIDRGGLPWWDEIAWMVRASAKTRVVIEPWITTPVVFDEPERERAVLALLTAYKAMPATNYGAFLESVGDATGTGRWRHGGPDRIWMNWDMIREMRGAGMEIGGHTITHPILAQMGPQEQLREIVGCGTRLREELGEPMRDFSYPVGHPSAFDDVTRRCLKHAEVRYAFSYHGGFRRFNEWDDYDIRRIAVESYIGSDWFRTIITLPGFLERVRA